MSSSSSKKPSVASKTAAKSTTKAKPALKKVPSPAEVPAPKAASAEASTASPVAGPVLKKQELIEKVVRKSGIKKKDAKPVVEAMLEVLGETLADGREFNLQPMGKLKLNRTKETAGARIIVAKIRQSKGPETSTPPGMPAAAE